MQRQRALAATHGHQVVKDRRRDVRANQALSLVVLPVKRRLQRLVRRGSGLGDDLRKGRLAVIEPLGQLIKERPWIGRRAGIDPQFAKRRLRRLVLLASLLQGQVLYLMILRDRFCRLWRLLLLCKLLLLT